MINPLGFIHYHNVNLTKPKTQKNRPVLCVKRFSKISPKLMRYRKKQFQLFFLNN